MQVGGIPPITVDALVVFAIIAVALILFITEPIPIDVTAIAVLFVLIVLSPWTGIDPVTGVSGFSSSATITVLAMFILSEGIRQSGLINIIGGKISIAFGDSPFKQLLAVLGLSGSTAGFINNTPVVAIMIPMVATISSKTGISPSKLLMPISYVAMLGGMLTLIGTSTNILASDVSARLIDRPFGMFEFTQLGILVLLTGIVYFATIGRFLVPERIDVREELVGEFQLAEYLTEVVVKEDSPLVGNSVTEGLRHLDIDADIVQLVRGSQVFNEPLSRKVVRPGDILVLRTDKESLVELIEHEGVDLAPGARVTDATLELEESDRQADVEQRLVEVVISPEASLIGETLDSLNFREWYGATVLAIRRGGELIHARMDKRRLRGGDTLLIQTTEDSVRRFTNDRNFIVAQDLTLPNFRQEKIPIAIGIIAIVVALAALDILPIMVSAIGGIVAMVATRCVQPKEMYQSVDWSVIFLLAGLIPLGVAMERSGAAEWLASVIIVMASGLTPILIVGLFYIITALLTNVISNNASVVLMIPVGIDAAAVLGSDPFAFIMAVTFGASTALLTPIGYQTNLMVYGPGGYKFMDFVRVGAPLQIILAVVTTVGIALIWGV